MAAYHSPVLEGAPNFTGGLIGYFGYDTVRYMEKKLTNVPEDDIHMPDCHLFLYEELLAYDHLNSNGIVILNLHTDGDLGAQYAAAQWRAEELADIVRHYNPQPQERRHHGESVVRSNLTKEQYSQMVRDAKEYIKNGDIFQIVLSQRFEISNPPDSFSVYRKLRATNPSPYLYYFHTPDYDVAGASPAISSLSLQLSTLFSRVKHLHFWAIKNGDQRRDPQSTHCRNKAQRTNTGRGHCQRKGTCRRPQGTCRAHHAGRPGTQRCG